MEFKFYNIFKLTQKKNPTKCEKIENKNFGCNLKCFKTFTDIYLILLRQISMQDNFTLLNDTKVPEEQYS